MKISNKFFKEHPLEEFSVAKIAYVGITLGDNREIQSEIEDTLKTTFNAERQEIVETEANRITCAQTAEEIIDIMRKMKETINRSHLCNKILQEQDRYMPAITEMYCRNRYDKFIETAAEILYHANTEYLIVLYENYKQIKSVYAQAVLCLLLAMKEIENINEFLMNEYNSIEKYYPDEGYSEFPLLALYIANGKL